MIATFDGIARKAIEAAQDEARTLAHNYIGTEHLLLGLLVAADTPGVRALAQHYPVDGARDDAEALFLRTPGATRYVPDDVLLSSVGIDGAAVRERARKEFGQDAAPGRLGSPAFTPRSAGVLQRAVATADAEQREATADDILVALLADSDAAATRAVRERGIDLESVLTAMS